MGEAGRVGGRAVLVGADAPSGRQTSARSTVPSRISEGTSNSIRISVIYRSSCVAPVIRSRHATAFNRSASTSGRSRAMKWPAFGTCVKSAAGSSCLLASRSEGRDQSFSP